MQLLDSLAAVLENQVCSAVGEDLHICVHTQHQHHLESPCPLPSLSVCGHQQAQTSIYQWCKNQGCRQLSDYCHLSASAWLCTKEEMFTFINQNSD